MSVTDKQQWEVFKAKHNKAYEAEEESRRFEIFQSTLRKIEEHQAKYEKGETTFTMEINQFADLTPEEMKSRCGFRPRPQQ